MRNWTQVLADRNATVDVVRDVDVEAEAQIGLAAIEDDPTPEEREMAAAAPPSEPGAHVERTRSKPTPAAKKAARTSASRTRKR